MKRIVLWVSKRVSEARSWLRAVTQRERLEAEMEAELATHLERLTADLARAGVAPKEAARRARVALGSTVAHKDGMRASVGLRLWDELGADLRYAARRLRRSVGFTAVAAISLALAIGANTTIFSLAKQLLYERLAVPRASELRLLAWRSLEHRSAVHHVHGDYDPLPGGRVASNVFSYPIYEQLRAQNRVLRDLFAFKETATNATFAGDARPVQVEAVSGNYYTELGVQPVLGRAIGPEDDAQPGQGAVTVLSYGVWEREFGRSPAVLGQTVKINNAVMTIIGVNPPSFTGAKNVQQSPEFFVPLKMYPLISLHAGPVSGLNDPGQWWVNIMGRAKPGVSDASAQAALQTQLTAAVRAMMPVRPQDDLPQMDLRDGGRGLFEQGKIFARPMTVLMTMVGFVLLLACANIANLMLARSSQRKREMSVRLALGAGRLRILRQMLVESVALAALGGAGGLVMGYFGSILIPKLTETSWERSELHIHFDWRVFAFTAAVTIATGLVAGLAPALAAARSNTSEYLKDGSQSVTRRRSGWAGKSLVGFQIAISTLLVVGAGLFLRTLAGLNAVDVGFRTDHLLLAQVDVPLNRYGGGKDIALHRELEAKIAAIPGVDVVAAAADTYISDDRSDTDFLPEGEVFDREKKQDEYYNVVGDRFFETLRIPILAGRGFGPQDTATSPKVGVINEALAKLRFPGQNPVGRRFTVGLHDVDGHGSKSTENLVTIVGVCANTRYANLRELPPPQFFLPYQQESEVGSMTYEIHTQTSPAAITPLLHKALSQVDPDLPLANVRTQEEQIEAATQQERIFVAMTSSFGMLALALASVGVYGVMAYSVAQRTNEIGIRLALGALPRQVLAMVLREASWISAAGIAAGLAAALMLARLIKSMLYGLGPADPVSLLAGAGLLALAGLAASWIPARRAASVQPVEALRHE